MSGLFITGVGTGVGKTRVMTILCHQLRAMGRNVTALKPVVSGFVEGDPESDPALILDSLEIPPTRTAIESISPWRFQAPLSPRLAARREGQKVSLSRIAQFCHERAVGVSTFCLIEGAGGVMSPICEYGTCLDLIQSLGEPAVLVTGTYLGAISHTLTALAALRACRGGVRAIVVSESAEGVGLADTIEELRAFGAVTVPVHSLPRLEGGSRQGWRNAPDLTGLCELHDE